MERLSPLLERYYEAHSSPDDDFITNCLEAAAWAHNDLCILLYRKYFNKDAYICLTEDEKKYSHEQFSFIDEFDQIPQEGQQLTNMYQVLIQQIQEFTPEELDQIPEFTSNRQ